MLRTDHPNRWGFRRLVRGLDQGVERGIFASAGLELAGDDGGTEGVLLPSELRLQGGDLDLAAAHYLDGVTVVDGLLVAFEAVHDLAPSLVWSCTYSHRPATISSHYWLIFKGF